MPRANRHYVPGHIWHITHRCHNKEFLFEKPETRHAWRTKFFQAAQRFKLPVLDYVIMHNHIHVLIQDAGLPKGISRCMQVAQGTFASEFNVQHDRVNAFWGDRYHATAIEGGQHLLRCMAYIDLNMVRAGAVTHPADWPDSGYGEIQQSDIRSPLVDIHRLSSILNIPDVAALRVQHKQFIEHALSSGKNAREDTWTQSLAVGSRAFIESFAGQLGDRIGNKTVEDAGDNCFAVREPQTAGYGANDETCFLAGENSIGWEMAD